MSGFNECMGGQEQSRAHQAVDFLHVRVGLSSRPFGRDNSGYIDREAGSVNPGVNVDRAETGHLDMTSPYTKTTPTPVQEQRSAGDKTLNSSTSSFSTFEALDIAPKGKQPSKFQSNGNQIYESSPKDCPIVQEQLQRIKMQTEMLLQEYRRLQNR